MIPGHQLSTSYQDGAGQTLQQVQQPPSVLQVAEHIFDGRLPRLVNRKLQLKKITKEPQAQNSTEKLQLPHYLGELCIYPFGESFLLNCVMLICGTKGGRKKEDHLKRWAGRPIWAHRWWCRPLNYSKKNNFIPVPKSNRPYSLLAADAQPNGGYSCRQSSLKASGQCVWIRKLQVQKVGGGIWIMFAKCERGVQIVRNTRLKKQKSGQSEHAAVDSNGESFS